MLQRRVLFHPPAFEGSAGLILTLSDAGALLEVRTPQAPPPAAAAAKTQRSGKRKGVKAPRSKPPSEESSAPRRNKAAASSGAGSGSAPSNGTEGLGACPLCGATVVEQERSFGCSGWWEGCKFTIWKTIAGKKISAKMAQSLVGRGRTSLLKGFKSKTGKPFDAHLKLEEGVVRFEFDA